MSIRSATTKKDVSVDHEEKRIIDFNQKSGKHSTSKRQKSLPQTIHATFDLVKQGYTLETIAMKRELSAYTISEHLSILIMHGLVDVFDFVDSYTYTQISNLIQNMPKSATLKKIKSRCPEGIKRNTIRMVMADVKRRQQNIKKYIKE